MGTSDDFSKIIYGGTGKIIKIIAKNNGSYVEECSFNVGNAI